MRSNFQSSIFPSSPPVGGFAGAGNLQSRNREEGFTMMEIIIVFALIGVLGAAMIGNNFLPTLLRSRDTKRKSDLGQVAKALEGYMNDFGAYPLSSVDGEIMGCGVGSVGVCAWGGGFSNDDGTVYMAKLPQDSKTPEREYYYEAGPAGRAWKLYSKLENEDDPVLDTNGDGQYVAADDDYAGTDCGVSECNYGISSSNVTMGTPLLGY